MSEVPRPAWRPSPLERARAGLEFLGVARLVAAAASVLVVAGGGWWLLHAPAAPIEQSLPRAGAVAGSTSTVSSAASAAPTPTGVAAPTTAPGIIVVQAAGAVVHPGVYTLPVGSRIHELIARAGGPLPGADPDALPLATVLVDGQRVHVPMIGEVIPAASGPASAPGPAPGPLDLNRATAAELDGLPGVGPATAAAIVDHRTVNGPYRTVDDLLDVRGIGPAKLDAMRALVTV